MGLPEHIYSVLVVSASNKFNDSLRRLLPEDRYSPVILAADVSDARRKLLEERYDLVIVNTPLPDDFGTRLALDVCASSGTGVLLLVGAEHYPDVNARVSPYGVLVLSKPTSAQLVSQSLLLLCGTRERLRRMEQKTARNGTISSTVEELSRMIVSPSCTIAAARRANTVFTPVLSCWRSSNGSARCREESTSETPP